MPGLIVYLGETKLFWFFIDYVSCWSLDSSLMLELFSEFKQVLFLAWNSYNNSRFPNGLFLLLVTTLDFRRDMFGLSIARVRRWSESFDWVFTHRIELFLALGDCFDGLKLTFDIFSIFMFVSRSWILLQLNTLALPNIAWSSFNDFVVVSLIEASIWCSRDNFVWSI